MFFSKKPSGMLRCLLLALCLFAASNTQAQIPIKTDTTDAGIEDLEALLETTTRYESKSRKDFTTATFKTTRLVTGHSIENVGAGVLDFRISHRFGAINTGAENFFGLDGAVTRLGFDYGITPWLTAGVGRSSFQKELDGFVKAKILRQTTDNRMPFSASYVGSVMLQTMSATAPNGGEYYFSNRLCYANQLLIARKFGQRLSLQVMPSHVHYNVVATLQEPNDVFALGIGGRMKLSNRISLNAEYYYTLNPLPGMKNALAVGFDIETGGHVFQLHFTNSTGMSERTYIGQTTDSWTDGGIHFGFNISRVFTIVKPKGFENSRNKIW